MSAPAHASVRRVPAVASAVAGAFVGIALVLLVFAHAPEQRGLDLAVYRSAVHAALDHQRVYGTAFGYELPFAYPPTALLLLVWAGLPANVASPVLFVVGAVCIGVSAERVLDFGARFAGRFPWVVVLMLASGTVALCLPVGLTLYFGQVNLIVMALVVFDLLGPRRPWTGVLLGIAVAIKLTPLLFVLWLLLRREWVIARNALGALAVLICVSAVAFPDVWRQYLSTGAYWATRGNQALGADPNRGVFGVAARVFGTNVWSVGLAIIVAVLTVAGALVVAGRLGSEAPAVAVTLVGLAACVATPLAWVHHWVWWPLLGLALMAQPRFRRIGVIVFAFCLLPVDLWPQAGYLVASVGVVLWLTWVTRGAPTGYRLGSGRRLLNTTRNATPNAGLG